MAQEKKKLSELMSKEALQTSRVDFMSSVDKEDDCSIEECILDMEYYIETNAPKGKTIHNFTGGYIQQLSNSRCMYLFYGVDSSNNKLTVKINLDSFQEYLYIRNIFDIYIYYTKEVKKEKRISLRRRRKK